MLRLRVLTAIILIPLVLLAIFYLPQLPFELLTGAIMLGCAWEWASLMQMSSLFERLIYLALVALLCFAVTWLAMGYFLYAMMVGVVALIILVHRYQVVQGQFSLKEFWWYVIGIVILVGCWYSLNIIRFRVGGTWGITMLLLIVWAADTGAYFGGKYFGKTPLAPLVSPKKTWEGLKCGGLAVFVLTLVQVVFVNMTFAVFVAHLLLNAVTFGVCVYGDLFESMMKRMANCKDSGGLLPGHGGLLDRLDSLFFAAPCYAMGLLLLAIHFPGV